MQKTVLITGGAAGIGRATASTFAAAGYRVAVWDVADGASLAELEGELRGSAGEVGVRVSKVDVTDAEAVESGVADLLAAWGRIDVLVNNAGITRDARLIKFRDGELVGRMEESQFDSVVSVNLKGVFLCTRAVAPGMKAQGGGVVLNASSVVGLYGNFGQTNYAATKAGVIAMTQTWARELGRDGIRVNAVAPGFIATEMVMAIPEKVRDKMAAATPLGRLGEPKDIAEAYLWLASDSASFIHGAVLSVDGGLVPGT